MEANDFINSITNKEYNRIRKSNGDAECRRLLKEHLIKQLSLTGVVQPEAEVCDCGKKILKQAHFHFNNKYYCVCGRVIAN